MCAELAALLPYNSTNKSVSLSIAVVVYVMALRWTVELGVCSACVSCLRSLTTRPSQKDTATQGGLMEVRAVTIGALWPLDHRSRVRGGVKHFGRGRESEHGHVISIFVFGVIEGGGRPIIAVVCFIVLFDLGLVEFYVIFGVVSNKCSRLCAICHQMRGGRVRVFRVCEGKVDCSGVLSVFMLIIMNIIFGDKHKTNNVSNTKAREQTNKRSFSFLAGGIACTTTAECMKKDWAGFWKKGRKTQ